MQEVARTLWKQPDSDFNKVNVHNLQDCDIITKADVTYGFVWSECVSADDCTTVVVALNAFTVLQRIARTTKGGLVQDCLG